MKTYMFILFISLLISIPFSVFIHELIHIYQFKRHGLNVNEYCFFGFKDGSIGWVVSNTTDKHVDIGKLEFESVSISLFVTLLFVILINFLFYKVLIYEISSALDKTKNYT